VIGSEAITSCDTGIRKWGQRQSQQLWVSVSVSMFLIVGRTAEPIGTKLDTRIHLD